MYFDNQLGLVTDDQGDQRTHIPWRHVHGLWKWLETNTGFQFYPGFQFTREQVAFILANYEER